MDKLPFRRPRLGAGFEQAIPTSLLIFGQNPSTPSPTLNPDDPREPGRPSDRQRTHTRSKTTTAQGQHVTPHTGAPIASQTTPVSTSTSIVNGIPAGLSTPATASQSTPAANQPAKGPAHTATPTPSSGGGGGGLSSGAIAAAVVVPIVVIFVIATLVIFLCRRRRKTSTSRAYKEPRVSEAPMSNFAGVSPLDAPHGAGVEDRGLGYEQGHGYEQGAGQGVGQGLAQGQGGMVHTETGGSSGSDPFKDAHAFKETSPVEREDDEISAIDEDEEFEVHDVEQAETGVAQRASVVDVNAVNGNGIENGHGHEHGPS